MALAMRLLPLARIPRPRLLTYVPSARGQENALPANIVEAVRDRLPENFWGVPDPVVIPTLKVPKLALKNMAVVEKIAQWDKILQTKGIHLSQSVQRCSILVVDDLYQSGASLWSCAKYLKTQQAGMVIGLACVKSLRDTDNR
jgi:hypothetical protein